MHETDILGHLLIVLTCAVPFALALRAFGQSTIVGYLLAGLVIGPGGLHLIPAESIQLLAEVGVGLLLFEIGIELSLGKLAAMRRVALGAGALQVLGTTVVAWGLVYALTGRQYEGIYVGCAIALSSSAIVLKTLADRGDLDAPHTAAATGVAIFQDLATVPMMVVLPALGAGGTPWEMALPVGKAIVRAALLLGLLYLTSRYIVDRLLFRVAQSRSPEVFVITIMVLVLGAAAGSAHAGLSLALGAFIAGILLADSKYAHQILADVSPFKGVFQATFFVSVGMLIDPSWVVAHPGTVAVAAAAVIVGKALLATLALVAIGVPARVATATGVLLSQAGEFSFVLVALGRRRGLITEDDYQLVLAASFASMAVAPVLIANVRRIVDALAHLPVVGSRISGAPDAPAAAEKLSEHAIVCGFGPVGREVVSFLASHGMRYVVIELNPRTVKEHAARGVPISFGDFANPRVLEHAGVATARALVVTAPDMEAGHRAIRVARSMNARLLIVARTKYQGQAPKLVAEGANEVVEEEFETAIEVVARLVQAFGVSRSEAVGDMLEQRAREGAAQDVGGAPA